MTERGDDYYVERLIERTRLLLATSDEIPVETKLQAQPLLKELEQALAASPAEQDRDLVRGRYALLCRELDQYPDLAALLAALRNFVSYL